MTMPNETHAHSTLYGPHKEAVTTGKARTEVFKRRRKTHSRR